MKDTLQTLIDIDMKTSGAVSAGTLDAIAAQGYAYKDGQLEKQTEPQADISTTANEPEAQPTRASIEKRLFIFAANFRA